MNKQKKSKIIVYIMIAFMIIPAMSLITQAEEQTTETNYVIRNPIYINNDSGFNITNGVTLGNGTESNPYIIREWSINGTGYGRCIWIGNTTKYVIITNCELYNPIGGGLGGAEATTYLFNATNVSMVSNNIYDDYNSNAIGIYISSGDISLNTTRNVNINIEANIIHDFEYGIGLDEVENITIYNNNIYDCNVGITYFDSIKNSIMYGNIINNNQYQGIYVSSDSTNITFWHNEITNNNRGLNLTSSIGNLAYNNIFINNTIHAYHEGGNDWNYNMQWGGNYWDDYTGVDLDINGYGDTPYILGLVIDYYPLMDNLTLYSFPLPYHDFISIYTNSDFTEENGVSSGTGTEQDPYIIENWIINGTDMNKEIVNKTYPITIDDTWSFNLGNIGIINDANIWVDEDNGSWWWELNDYCEVNQATGEVTMTDGWPLWDGLVIHVWFNYTNVGCIDIIDTDAYCIIRNCEVFGSRDSEQSSGIYTIASSNIIMEDCQSYDNNVGIKIHFGTNVIVDNCVLTENGYIDTGGGGGFEFTGVQVTSSSYITVSNNQFYDEQTVAIHMYRSYNCTVEYNYISNAIESGIESDGMTYSVFRGNYVTGCLNGFYGSGQLTDDKMEYCFIINNTFIDNIEKGIFMLDTENNTFYHNNLINNGVNVIEFNNDFYNGGVYTNVWYDDDSGEGNYYDDYSEEEPGVAYVIYNNINQITESNYDIFPLSAPYTGLTEEITEEEEPLTIGVVIIGIMISILPIAIIILLLKQMMMMIKMEETKDE